MKKLSIAVVFFLICSALAQAPRPPVDKFTLLRDVPNNYTGQANKLVTVKGTEDGLQFTTSSGGTPGGSNTQFQFNNSGVFGGTSNFTFSSGNITYSDPTKIFLFGASSIPDVSGSLWPWQDAQLMISGRTADTNAAFAVVGDYRSGISGERNSTYIGPNGEIYTNRFINLYGISPTHAYDASSNMEIGVDVPVGLTIKSTGLDSSGQFLYTGGGPANNHGDFLRSFGVGSQGTVYLNNVYGGVGGAPIYSKPQIMMGDIHNASTPSWTYGCVRQNNGTLTIGECSSSGTLNNPLSMTTTAATFGGSVTSGSGFFVGDITIMNGISAGGTDPGDGFIDAINGYTLNGTTLAFSTSPGNSKYYGTNSGGTVGYFALPTGTVTSFSSGNLSPLFTTSVTNATTTPALSFTLSTAGAQTVFGNNTGSTGVPVFSSAPQFLKIGNLTTNGFVKTGSGDGTLSIDTNTYLTGNQTITLSGDVTGSGATAITTTLAAGNAGNLNSGTLLAARMPALTGDVTTSAGSVATTIASSVNLSGNPTTTTQAATDNSTRIATTSYVTTGISNAIAGVNPAVAVQAATTAAGDTSSFTYNNGVSGIGATLTGPTANTAVTIDGFTFTALGQRLLVKNDTQSPSGAFNGVYYVTTLQAIGIKPVLTRTLDYDQPSDINNTGAIPVVNGTANANTTWVLTSSVTTVGTDPLTFTQFSLNPSNVVNAIAGENYLSKSGNTITANAVNLSGTNATGTLAAGRFPALTGDVTTTAGSLTTALGNIPNTTTAAGDIVFTNTAAPGSPASGKDSIFTDSTDLRFHDKNAAGTIGTTVVSDTGASHNFLTAISTSGVISKAQPADSDISFTDITTGNSSTSNHGFLKKLDNTAGHFMDGTGNWSTPAGTGVTSVATTSPISGGTITTTGTISLLTNVDFAFSNLQTITIAPAANTSADALRLYDTTAASSGNQQYSGAVRFEGQGWKTNATAASQAVDMREYLIPVQGAANPSSYLSFDHSENAGSFSNILSLFSSGGLALGSTTDPTAGIFDAHVGFQVAEAASSGQALVADGTKFRGVAISGSGATVTLSSAGVLTLSAIANATLSNSTITLNAGTNTGYTTPGAMSLGSTYTFGTTSDNLRFNGLGLGVAAPTTQGQAQFLVAPAANTQSDSLQLYDTTVASSGNQQYSGAIRFQGQGWKTTATAASQNVDMRNYLVPVQGAANPSSYLSWDQSINAGSFSNILSLFSSGGMSLGSTTDPSAGVFNAQTGFRVAGGATTGHALRGNGTNFVDAAMTATDVGLGNVTNDAQTKSAIVPNTAPSSGQILVGNAGGTAYAPVSLSGSGATATLSSAGVLTLSAIANATLSNSSITIGGASTALGGTVTATTILDSIGSTQGNILYRGSSTWSVLATGTNGALLQTGGSSANPAWTTSTYPSTAGAAGHVPRSNATNYVDSALSFSDLTSVSVPTVRAVSAIAHGTSGTVTANLPTGHTTNDILIAFVEHNNSNTTPAAPTGYTVLHEFGQDDTSTKGIGVAVFWKRDGGSESAPTFTVAADHLGVTMMAVTGCPTSGDPLHWLSNGWKRTASTSSSVTGGTTTIDNCLVTFVAMHDISSTSAQYSSSADSNLSNLVKQIDTGTTDGIGGGMAVTTGTLATAGSTGALTATIAASTKESFLSFAMIPSGSVQQSTSLRGEEVKAFAAILASNVTDPTYVWAKPTGAKTIRIIAIGGGGAGGSGRTAATACGSSGGGGGSDAQLVIQASDAGATANINAGKGGIGGSNKTAATASIFTTNSVTILQTNVAGIGNDATSGTTGSSGIGGAVGSLVTPNLAANGAGGVGGQSGGACNGNGGTGSTAEWGGGGGACGNVNNASGGAGGTSVRGAGGGGGGTTGGTGAGGNGGGGGGGAGASSADGASAADSSFITLGAGGGRGGGGSTTTGGNGGFPGGGGGGGGNATTSGGNGGAGVVVVITSF